MSRCVFKSGFFFAAFYRKDHNQLKKKRERKRERHVQRERDTYKERE